MLTKTLAALFLLAACQSAPPPAPPVQAAPPAARVRVSVSVDWEGASLQAVNLAAMRRLTAALPDVPLTHFLNAAYFTKAGADCPQVSKQIESVLRPIDETGLHVHCWRSLVEAAGVTFRTSPTYWGEGFPLAVLDGDSGHEVELEAYSVAEIRSLVRCARNLLTGNGFTIGPWFRAGGWVAGPRVLEAIAAEGFRIDSSATDVTWFDELAGLALPGRVQQLWPGVTRNSAPFAITTPAGEILEMPDTGALADYTTAVEIHHHIADGMARLGTHDVFLHVGFHQETAAEYAARIITAIQMVQGEFGDRVVFEKLSTAAARRS
jgi:hypothetical protein